MIKLGLHRKAWAEARKKQMRIQDAIKIPEVEAAATADTDAESDTDSESRGRKCEHECMNGAGGVCDDDEPDADAMS